MAKLVKLTDEIGAILQERADKDNVSLAGEIKLLLDGKDDNNINQRLDRLGAYLEKKFTELKESIEDTTIDRLDRGEHKKAKMIPLDWKWPTLQELLYDVATEKDYVSKAAYDEMHESSNADEIKYYIEDDYVWGDFFGEKKPYLSITPNIKTFLASKGVVWQQ